ncbi:MAG: OmpA family protein [Elusimicrobiota bacterium]|jgi:outer membrane protein OmpA-like peptidoglycan-associated protein|nr:OmpA family protein [Elusimicrobiota bacterium]
MNKKKNKKKILLTAALLLIVSLSFAETADYEQVWNLLTAIQTAEPSNPISVNIKSKIQSSQIKELNQLSGEFIINALKSAAFINDLHSIHSAIVNKEYQKSSASFWGQYLSLSNSFGKDSENTALFKAKASQVIGGIGIAARDKYIVGVYGVYNIDSNFSQYLSEGSVKNISGGLYLGVLGDIFNLRAAIDAGMQTFDIQRVVVLSPQSADTFFNKSNFQAYSIRSAVEADLIIPISQHGYISPIIAGYGAMIANDKIIEEGGAPTNLIIDGASYTMLNALMGIKVGSQANQRVNWNLKAFYGSKVYGNDFRYKVSFKEAADIGSIDILGTEADKTFVGANLSLEYSLSARISLFASGGALAAIDGDLNIFSNNFGVGAKIKLGSLGEAPKVEISSLATSSSTAKQDIGAEETAGDDIELMGEENIREYLRHSQDLLVKSEEERLGIAAGDGAASLEEENKQQLIEELKKRIEEARQRRERPLIATFNMELAKFETGSYILTQSAKDFIKQLAGWIEEYDYNLITIEGHTDSTGDLQTNILLSSMRARAVRDELIKNGVPPIKINYIGYGPSMPVSNNRTASGKLKNRRVELFVE